MPRSTERSTAVRSERPTTRRCQSASRSVSRSSGVARAMDVSPRCSGQHPTAAPTPPPGYCSGELEVVEEVDDRLRTAGRADADRRPTMWVRQCSSAASASPASTSAASRSCERTPLPAGRGEAIVRAGLADGRHGPGDDLVEHLGHDREGLVAGHGDELHVEAGVRPPERFGSSMTCSWSAIELSQPPRGSCGAPGPRRRGAPRRAR